MIKNAKVKAKNVPKKQLRELEGLINGLYSKKSNNKHTQQIYDGLFKALDKFVEEQIKKVEINDNEAKVQYYGLREHKAGIRKETVNKRLLDIERLLNLPTIVDNLVKDNGTNIISQIKQAAREIDQLMSSDEVLSESGLTIMVTDDTKTIIDQFDKMYTLIATIGQKYNLDEIYGYGFEKMVNAFNNLLENKVEDITDELIMECFNSANVGQDSKSRGTFSSNINKSASEGHKMFFQKGKTHNIYASSNFKEEKELDRYVSITAFDERMGKVDAIFTLPEAERKLNISLKSWNGMGGRDFGETSLFNAITRSAGIDFALSYGLVTGYYYPFGDTTPPTKGLWDTVNAHSFAKICIFLDVVMGFSQEEGFVDTILIQDRSGADWSVRAYSIYQLLKNFEKVLDNSPGTNYITYNPSNLNIRYVKKAEWWLKKLQTQMHSIKVSVGSGILKES